MRIPKEAESEEGETVVEETSEPKKAADDEDAEPEKETEEEEADEYGISKCGESGIECIRNALKASGKDSAKIFAWIEIENNKVI